MHRTDETAGTVLTDGQIDHAGSWCVLRRNGVEDVVGAAEAVGAGLAQLVGGGGAGVERVDLFAVGDQKMADRIARIGYNASSLLC